MELFCLSGVVLQCRYSRLCAMYGCELQVTDVRAVYVEYSAIWTAIFLTEPDPGQPRTVLCSLTADMKTFTKMIHDNNEVHRMNYLYSFADAYKYHNEKLC